MHRTLRGLTTPHSLCHIEHMNALANQITFASAYRQLRPVERLFVDAVVAEMQRVAERNNEHISTALRRPITTVDERGMLEKPMVCAAIAERVNEIALASELSVQRLIKEYTAIAFANIRDYQDIDPITGNITFDFTRCSPDQMAAIKSVRMKEPSDEAMDRGNATRECTLTFHDKMIALEKLSQLLSMMDPNNPHWHNGGRNTPALTTDISETAAADAYAALLGA